MKENDYSQINCKELGSLQQKTLFYLAENPESHKQGIQQGINHPADQYGSVLKAANSLEKMGYITSTKTTSQKNNKIKLYSCTQLGIIYALSKNNTADIPKILNAYEKTVKFCKSIKQLYDLWGHECFSIYLKDATYILPIVQKDGFEAALPHLLMQAIENEKIIDPKKRDQNAKIALKLSPETRKMFEDLQKKLNEVLDSA